jgi:hypothetical protein
MSVAYVHPDPADPEVLAGIARFDQNQVRARLIPGTTQPDRHWWPERGQVPGDQRAGLVATFNSGFKMADTPGGFYADGQLARPLREGAASLVIDRAGRVSIEQWGRDRRLGPDITAVRQNLALIVDHGEPVAGLEANRAQQWGRAKNQWQHTWRSAIGVDRNGTLFYLAGDGLTLVTLARALAHTGVVRGMELDMHSEHVNLFAYRHNPGAAAPTPIALLNTMPTPWDRYLYPDQRDFIALTLR